MLLLDTQEIGQKTSQSTQHHLQGRNGSYVLFVLKRNPAD